jgi:hypothetical protein
LPLFSRISVIHSDTLPALNAEEPQISAGQPEIPVALLLYPKPVATVADLSTPQ